MAQLFNNFWCSFGRSIVEIKKNTCNDWVNLNKLQKTVFFFLSRILWLQVVTSSNQVVIFLLQRGFASVAIAAPKSTCSFQLSSLFVRLVTLGDNRCVCRSCGGGEAQHLLWPGERRSQMPRSSLRGEVSEGFKWLVHCLASISTSSSIINTNLSIAIASLRSTESLQNFGRKLFLKYDKLTV